MRANQYTNHWSVEEDELIKAYDSTMSYEELTDLLNKKFGTDRSYGNVRGRRNKLISTRKKNGMHSARAKQTSNVKPVGTITYDGEIKWIKYKQEYIRERDGKNHDYREDWMPYHLYVWEQAHGKLPNDYVIIFLDGNHENCELSNLYAVHKKINGLMCRWQWHFDNPQMKLTAIKWCELYYATKGDKNDR